MSTDNKDAVQGAALVGYRVAASQIIPTYVFMSGTPHELRITPDGVTYRGEYLADVGKVHAAMIDVLSGNAANLIATQPVQRPGDAAADDDCFDGGKCGVGGYYRHCYQPTGQQPGDAPPLTWQEELERGSPETDPTLASARPSAATASKTLERELRASRALCDEHFNTILELRAAADEHECGALVAPVQGGLTFDQWMDRAYPIINGTRPSYQSATVRELMLAAWHASQSASVEGAMESAITACRNERVDHEATKQPEDAAYNQAIEHCIDAIRALKPKSASVEDAQDAAMCRWLRDSKFNALYLTRNEDHSTNYVTAKEWIEEYSPEAFAHDDPDEVQAMKDTDTIWHVQIYPDTPIGSYSWHGATLDSALGAAIAAMTTDKDAGTGKHGGESAS